MDAINCHSQQEQPPELVNQLTGPSPFSNSVRASCASNVNGLICTMRKTPGTAGWALSASRPGFLLALLPAGGGVALSRVPPPLLESNLSHSQRFHSAVPHTHATKEKSCHRTAAPHDVSLGPLLIETNADCLCFESRLSGPHCNIPGMKTPGESTHLEDASLRPGLKAEKGVCDDPQGEHSMGEPSLSAGAELAGAFSAAVRMLGVTLLAADCHLGCWRAFRLGVVAVPFSLFPASRR